MENREQMKSTAQMKSKAQKDNPNKPPLQKVYVCSPYRAVSTSLDDRKRERTENEQRAQKACSLLTLLGYLPLAPHCYFTQFLSDEDPCERDQGIELGLEWLAESDEVWVFGERISDGMSREISRAKQLGIPIRYLPEPEELAAELYKALKKKLG